MMVMTVMMTCLRVQVGSVSTTVGAPPHWEMDVDAINDLDEEPKPVF